MRRTSIKGQVLADLVAEFAKPPLEEVAVMQNMDGKSVGTISLQEPLCWKVYVDGAANQRGSEVGQCQQLSSTRKRFEDVSPSSLLLHDLYLYFRS